MKKLLYIIALFPFVLFNAQETIISDNLTGKWKFFKDINLFDDTKTITFILIIEETINKSYGLGIVYPRLILRYESGETAAYIGWIMFIGTDDVLIISRLGDNEAEKKLWSISTNYEGTFSPEPDKLISDLLLVDRAIFQVTPFGESPKTVTFDTRGLENAIKPYADYLGWLHPQIQKSIITPNDTSQITNENISSELTNSVIIHERIAKAPLIYYFGFIILFTAIIMAI